MLHRISLTGDDQAKLIAKANSLSNIDITKVTDVGMFGFQHFDLMVEPILRLAIDDFFVKLIYIKNVPVPHDLEESPTETKWRKNTDRVLPSDLLHFYISWLLKTKPATYENEHGGRSIHNITPVKNHEGERSSAGDSVFPYHVEVPQDEDNPRYFSIACLRGDTSVHTNIIESFRLINNLNDDLYIYAHKPCINLRVGASYDNAGEVLQVPLIRSNEDDHFLFSSAEMYPIEGDKASEALYDSCMGIVRDDPDFSIALESGNFLLLDNRQLLHSRDVPKKVDSKRWLTRMYYS